MLGLQRVADDAMKILFVTQWFPPEQAPIGHMMKELGADLAKRGWEVTIVTGFPNHPKGVVFGRYRKRWFQEETVEGTRVWRVFLLTSPKRSLLNRILTFASFTLTSNIAILHRASPDLIFAVFQPLSIGLVLPFVARLKGARLVLNVQDLHPDVPIELGLIRNPIVIRLLRWIERRGYLAADALSVICDGFKEHCVAKGVAEQRIAVIENWIDPDEILPRARTSAFRQEVACSQEDFVVLYAGTIGWVSGAHVVLEAADLLREKREIKFVFVGEGPLVPHLSRVAREKKLTSVVFAPFQPRERLSDVQAISDVSVVSLLAGKGRASVPSKVLGYMAASRAVVASVDRTSETAKLVQEALCGVVVSPEDPYALANAILALESDPAHREQCGVQGRRFLEARFSRPVVTQKYAQLFARVAAT